MIKQTEKGKNAPYTIYHHTVIILILTIITVLQSLTEIHSYLNFDLINKELAQKNMILQHFRFYPSFTLFIIKTCNYFTILEIRGERKLFFPLLISCTFFGQLPLCTLPELHMSWNKQKTTWIILPRTTLLKNSHCAWFKEATV